MTKNDLFSNISYLIKFAEIFGPVNLKLNRKTHKMEICLSRYIICSTVIVLLIVTFSYFYVTEDAIEQQQKEIKLKMLLIFFYASVISRYLITILEYLYHKELAINFWNSVINLDNTLNNLNLKFKANNKLIQLMIIVPCVLNLSCTLAELITSNSFNVEQFLAFISVSVANVIECLIYLTFVTFMTIFKNYFIQLNNILKDTLKNGSSNSLVIIKNIGIIHQELSELVRMAVNLYSVQIIVTLINCVFDLSCYYLSYNQGTY